MRGTRGRLNLGHRRRRREASRDPAAHHSRQRVVNSMYACCMVLLMASRQATWWALRRAARIGPTTGRPEPQPISGAGQAMCKLGTRGGWKGPSHHRAPSPSISLRRPSTPPDGACRSTLAWRLVHARTAASVIDIPKNIYAEK